MKKYDLFVLLCIGIQLFGIKVPPSIEGNARFELGVSFKQKNTEEVFTDIYSNNFWRGWESVSGQGSNIATTHHIRAELPQVIKKLGIKTMLDAPCGDFNWMQALIADLDLDLYIGLDIVKPVIQECQQKFGATRRVFLCADLIASPLPKVDLVFSRDFLAHLSYKDARTALKNFKESGATYLLTSNHLNTKKNKNITTGLNYPGLPLNMAKVLYEWDKSALQHFKSV